MNYRDKYIKYKNKYIKLQKMKLKMQSGGSSNNIESNKKNIILIKAEWCGHCQHFKGTWNKLQEKYKNDYNFVTYDADNDKHMIDKYNVNGFPTLLIKNKNDEHVQYEGDRTVKSIIDFVEKI